VKANPENTARLVEIARDKTLALEARHAAFTRLVEQFQDIVFAFAFASLRNYDDAQDVAQNAFASAWHRLHQLRDPLAFQAWLKSIVAHECSAISRNRRSVSAIEESPHTDAETERLDYQSLVTAAMQTLPKAERDVVILFYFAGLTLPQIARSLHLKEGTVGKRLHSARLRMRRKIPNSVRTDFVRVFPSTDFVERVRRGLLDEYVGEYRFDERPDQIVRIIREGDLLVSDAADQRHVLVADGESVTTQHYDGEGRFRRNRRGEVTGFVYYEFGKRLGVARKIPAV
jgi:RNA polymerase sigma-70 factor (ECF subfamily)